VVTGDAPVRFGTPMISPATFDPSLDADRSSARVVRALALLAASSASVAMSLQLASMGRRLVNFLSRNELSHRDRTMLVVTLGIGAVVPVLFSGVSPLVWRARAARVIERLSDLAGIAVIAVFIPVLFCSSVWVVRPLNFLAVLTVTVVLLNAFGTQSFVAAGAIAEGAGPRLKKVIRVLTFPVRALERRAVALTVVSVAAVAYAAYTGYLTILDLHRLTMGSYDMGFFDNQMANSLAGRLFRNTIMYGPAGGNSIAGHAHFAHLLFLPIYAISPSSELLLGLQAVFVGLGAIALFFFAATQVSVRSALAMSLVFLLFAPLHGAQFYDFHWLLSASFFFFTIAYAIVREKYWLVPVPLLIFLALREDMSPGVAISGLFLFVTRARPRLGLALFVIGSVWFGVVKFVIMPAAGAWWFADIYKGFVAPGETGYGSIAKTLVTNPAYVFSSLLTEAKLIYVLHLFAPLAFLPLRRVALWLLAVPGFILTVLTTEYAAATSIVYQYPGHWVPYLFLGSVLALRLIRERSGAASARAALLTASFAVVAHSYVFGVVFQPRAFPGGGGKVAPSLTKKEATNYANVRGLVRMIPKKASVIATEYEVPLITFHPDAFSAALSDTDADYALVFKDHYHLPEGKQHFRNMFKRTPFVLVARKGEAFLFKRGATTPETKAALRDLGLE
jgi:uncharacterized membrane protein